MSGALTSITIAPAFGASLRSLESAELVAGQGILGDRHFGGVRQVTVICTGEVGMAAAEWGVAGMDPAVSRRNLVVDLPELPRDHGSLIRIGEVVLSVWRDCAPCELMDRVYGEGARQALRGRAGVSAQVVTGGSIRIGDPVSVEPARAEVGS
jgi:MOSC domain-containing protein YiiM